VDRLKAPPLRCASRGKRNGIFAAIAISPNRGSPKKSDIVFLKMASQKPPISQNTLFLGTIISLLSGKI
jgi:hypothetical protein